MAEPLILEGVRATSFIGYLQGLGILSVVGRQLDPGARGAWHEGRFALWTEESLESVVDFFVDAWSPAPVVSPWNGGSGFFSGDKKANDAFAPIDASDNERFAPYRAARTAGRVALEAQGLADKPEPTRAKPALLRELRARLDDEALEWLDAAVVLRGEGADFPPMLGSGGNDGRYDISANYAASVCAVLGLEPRAATRQSRSDALLALLGGQGIAGLRRMSLGQFRRDSSWVAAPDGEPPAVANPWELPLAVEGSLLFAAGAVRRLGAAQTAASAPFTVRTVAAGFGSAATGETARAEVWMPTWSQPASRRSVEALLREGRIAVGRRSAGNALDAVRAASTLGVARGIERFERFAILERAGLSNLAVHAGSVEVRPNATAEVLSGLDAHGWLRRLVVEAAGDQPTALRGAARELERAAFAVAQGGPAAVERLVITLGRAERALARGRPERLLAVAAPLQPWVAALDLSRAEIRVAVALASLRDRFDTRAGTPTLREMLHGTRLRGAYTEAANPLIDTAGTGARRLAAIAARREIDVARLRDDPGRSMRFDFGLALDAADLGRIARGAIDLDRVADLLDGLIALDPRSVRWPGERAPDAGEGILPPALATLVVAAHGHPDQSRDARLDPRLGAGSIGRLRADRSSDVLAGVLTRLHVAELAPIARASDLVTLPHDGPLLAIALLCRPSVSARWLALRRSTIQESAASLDPQPPETP